MISKGKYRNLRKRYVERADLSRYCRALLGAPMFQIVPTDFAAKVIGNSLVDNVLPNRLYAGRGDVDAYYRELLKPPVMASYKLVDAGQFARTAHRRPSVECPVFMVDEITLSESTRSLLKEWASNIDGLMKQDAEEQPE